MPRFRVGPDALKLVRFAISPRQLLPLQSFRFTTLDTREKSVWSYMGK
jgi:hypothetical protein